MLQTRVSYTVFLARQSYQRGNLRWPWNEVYISAIQPVCTVHPGVHQNMRGVHHYERVHKGASHTCHPKQILFTKTFC